MWTANLVRFFQQILYDFFIYLETKKNTAAFLWARWYHAESALQMIHESESPQSEPCLNIHEKLLVIHMP